MVKCLICGKEFENGFGPEICSECMNGNQVLRDKSILLAKRLLIDSIYSQAKIENIAVTFANTNDILNNVAVDNVEPLSISKVFALRNGWKFILDNLDRDIDLSYISELHTIIARDDVPYYMLGRPRCDIVSISGTSYLPPIPNVETVHKELMHYKDLQDIRGFIETGLYLMRVQYFQDGNKRIGSFVINKLLIQNGLGIFLVPVELDSKYKHLLVDYYTSNNPKVLVDWIIDNCYIKV